MWTITFKMAFEGFFCEGHTQPLDYVDTDLEIFNTLIRRMYSRHLGPIANDNLLEWEQDTKHSCGLWVLTDKLIVPALQNHVIKAICKNHDDRHENPDLAWV